MAQEQKSAPIEADVNIDLAMGSFDRQLAREYDYDLTTLGVEVDRSNPVTDALGLGRNYATVTQSYMIGSGEAVKFEQFSSDVHQMAYDFTARVMMELKNSYTTQVSLAAPAAAAVKTDDLYFQYDVLASSTSADPRDRGFAKGMAALALEDFETTAHDKLILAKVVPSSDKNFGRLKSGHAEFVDNIMSLAA